MPATGALIGTPASISDSVEPHTDAIDVEPFDDITSETTRIAYGHSSFWGSTGTSAALGERAVTDLAALRRTHTARLARGERREVVVVHVALLLVGRDRVEHLLHAQHAERRDREHLRLAPLEQAGAVRGGQQTDLGRQRSDLGGGAAVDTQTFVDDARAHDLLLQAPERPLHLHRPLGERAGRVGRAHERRHEVTFDLVEPAVAVVLVGDRHRRAHPAPAVLLDRGEHVVVVVGVVLELDRLDLAVLRFDAPAQLTLELDRSRDPLLRVFEAFRDHFFGDLRRAVLVEVPCRARCRPPRPS